MIDLHMHTVNSDGTDTPNELLQKAEALKLEIISITDHDSVGAYKNLNKDLFSGKIINGIEMKSFYKKVPIEVLGYGIDINKIKVNSVQIVEEYLLKHYTDVCDKLGLKYDINEIYVDKNNPERMWLSHSLINELLKYKENKKIIGKMENFTKEKFYRAHQCVKGSPFYFDETIYTVSLEETINRIHEAGGLVFLAHPLIYPYENKLKIIEEMISNFDFDGIECEYPLFDEIERNLLKRLAKKYNKYISGGTDYHGNNKKTTLLGTGINNNVNIDKSLISDWINKII